MIKTPEELKLQRFRNVETLYSKLRYGTSLTFADIRHNPRKVSKEILYQKKKPTQGQLFIYLNDYFLNGSSTMMRG